MMLLAVPIAKHRLAHNHSDIRQSITHTSLLLLVWEEVGKCSRELDIPKSPPEEAINRHAE